MNKITRIIIIVFLLGLFFLVRAFAAELFYDPLIEYFRNDYLYTTLPELDRWHLVVDMLFRYTINTLISLAIIWFLFQDKDDVKFVGFFHMVMFMIFIVVFVQLLRNEFKYGYLLPFYIRRFLIHPLFLLVILPALYYYKLKKKKINKVLR